MRQVFWKTAHEQIIKTVIGILNENKVRLKVELFQPEMPRTMQQTGWLEESRKKDDRCDLFPGSHGSELVLRGSLCIVFEVKLAQHTFYYQ